MFPSRAALKLGAWAARQEARKARCVASPPSQSPIGVVKRNHALNLASRIKNAHLARTKSSAGFRIADCLILLQEHGLDGQESQDLPAPNDGGLISMTVISRQRCGRNVVGPKISGADFE